MKMKQTRNPIPFVADDACDYLRVPLAGNRRHAIVDAHVLPSLREAGLRDGWSFNRAGNARYWYLRGHLSGYNTITVERLITGARRGQHVRYHDGNPLNLRLANLYLVEGRSKTNCTCILLYGEVIVPDFVDEHPKGLPKISERASHEPEGRDSPRGYRPVSRASAKPNFGARE